MIKRTALALLTTVLALCLPAAASADYEQVPEHFGVGGEAAQLEQALGMAVNETGEGGVPAGSLYVVGKNARVVRFAPGEEGEAPRFEEAWGWGIAAGGPSNEFVRCGPAYEGTASVTEHTYEHCKPAAAIAPFGGEEVGHFESLAAARRIRPTVTSTCATLPGRGRTDAPPDRGVHGDGVPVGEGFGDAGVESSTPPESIEAGPGELHRMSQIGGAITVDDTGTVYLTMSTMSAEPEQARVMSFAPSTPGDYETTATPAAPKTSPSRQRRSLRGSPSSAPTGWWRRVKKRRASTSSKAETRRRSAACP